MPIINKTHCKQTGLTLVELMVSLAIGALILSSLAYLASSTISSNTQQLKTTRLNQEMRAVMHLATRDLKRAGQMQYSTDALHFSTYQCLFLSATSGSGITVTASPIDTCDSTSTSSFDSWAVPTTAWEETAGLMIMATTLSLSGTTTYACGLITAGSISSLTISNVACPNASSAVAFPSTTVSRWHFANYFSSSLMSTLDNNSDGVADGITYRYDRDGDGLLDYPSECYGIRWNSASSSLRMETWVGSSTGNCTAGAWNNLTDTDTIQITDFRVVLVSPATSALREYRLSMTGRLKSDTNVTRTIEEIVRVRNDPVV